VAVEVMGVDLIRGDRVLGLVTSHRATGGNSTSGWNRLLHEVPFAMARVWILIIGMQCSNNS